MARHHLTKRAPEQDLARVVGDIGGVQAQVMSAAELQVAVRADCRVEDVRAALWKDKRLVKTWPMRGTLHLLPAEDLPLFTAAMHTHRVRTRNAWLNYAQMNESEFRELIDALGQALHGQALTRAELIAPPAKTRPARLH